jgi:two-component system OmpR family sensor kinase
VTRSFRFELALQATAGLTLALALISVVSVFALGSALDREIDATLLNVASIQAGSLTDSPTGEMRFHEWELTPQEATSVRELVRYAQVWRSDGVSLLRSQYMTSDLPLDSARLEQAADGVLTWTEGSFEGLPVRMLYYPLQRLGAAHESHVLQVAAPTGSRDALLGRVATFLALLCLGVALATFVGSWWLASRAIRPVNEVIDQAEEIEATSLDRRIQSYAETSEYRRLVDVLNTMLARIQSGFETQRSFTADASHELRSPLTAMRGELELALRRERHVDEYRRVLASTLEEVVRLSRITEDLLLLARSDSGVLKAKPEPVEIVRIVSSVIDRLAAQADAKDVRIDVRRSGASTAELDPVLVGQVVWNLVENAIKFTPDGGAVTVEVESTSDELTLTVQDTGPGFPDDRLDRVFGRFFRADRARTRGGETASTGLGLAIVKAVVEAHCGTVTAGNGDGSGARVVARFPRSLSAVEDGERVGVSMNTS